MYKTGRRSATGIANFCRHLEDGDTNTKQAPLHINEEGYKPIYYPVYPTHQLQESSSEVFTPTWSLPNGGDYTKSDGYRSLMAFNSQQRTAGKLVKRDRGTSGETVSDNDDHPHGISNMGLQDRLSILKSKAAPNASSLGYLFGGE